MRQDQLLHMNGRKGNSFQNFSFCCSKSGQNITTCDVYRSMRRTATSTEAVPCLPPLCPMIARHAVCGSLIHNPHSTHTAPTQRSYGTHSAIGSLFGNSHSTHTLPIQHPHSDHTVLILCSFCGRSGLNSLSGADTATHTAPTRYPYSTHTAIIQYSFCVHSVLILWSIWTQLSFWH